MRIINYEKLANVCLHADGGMCESCAKDVADGFKEEYPEINIDKLNSVIDRKIKDHYEHKS